MNYGPVFTPSSINMPLYPPLLLIVSDTGPFWLHGHHTTQSAHCAVVVLVNHHNHCLLPHPIINTQRWLHSALRDHVQAERGDEQGEGGHLLHRHHGQPGSCPHHRDLRSKMDVIIMKIIIIIISQNKVSMAALTTLSAGVCLLPTRLKSEKNKLFIWVFIIRKTKLFVGVFKIRKTKLFVLVCNYFSFLLSRVLAYIQIGTFIAVLMTISWIFSTFFFQVFMTIESGQF